MSDIWDEVANAVFRAMAVKQKAYFLIFSQQAVSQHTAARKRKTQVVFCGRSRVCYVSCFAYKLSAGFIRNPKNLTQKQLGKAAFLYHKCEKGFVLTPFFNRNEILFIGHQR